MELHMDGEYRTVSGNLEVKLLHYFENDPQYPWVGAVIYDGKVIPCAWTTDGRAQNKLHNLYDVSEGFVYVAKLFIAVRGKNFDDATRNLERELETKTMLDENWLAWSYEWSNTGGDYTRMRLAKGMKPDEMAHDDYSLTDLWTRSNPSKE